MFKTIALVALVSANVSAFDMSGMNSAFSGLDQMNKAAKTAAMTAASVCGQAVSAKRVDSSLKSVLMDVTLSNGKVAQVELGYKGPRIQTADVTCL